MWVYKFNHKTCLRPLFYCNYSRKTSVIDVLPLPLCDANKQECNLLSSDSQQWHGLNKQQWETCSALVASLEREVFAKMRGRLCSGDAHLLFCLSVARWKAFLRNPLEERHIGEGSVLLPVGMAAESCLAAHRQNCSQKAFMLSALSLKGED